MCVCVFVVWEGEKENRDIDREGECSIPTSLPNVANIIKPNS